MRSFSHKVGDVTSAEARAHPLVFYRRFFAGWTPDDLSAHAPIVYERLRRRGLLRLIPGKTPLPFGGDPVAYYRQHYAGLTRGQVHDQAPELYEHCRRNGLLAHIPLKLRIRFDDPVAYYREHCDEMTRRQAARAEPQFYSYLQRNGLLDAIPFASAKTAGATDRDGRQPETTLDTSPKRSETKPAGQLRCRLPPRAAARLECFRIIPE